MALSRLKNPILYSTMTVAAYNINMKYYGGLHYLWCTPYFGSDFASPHFTVPPSSSPWEIYETLRKEVAADDKHGTKVRLNRMGIRRGAAIMEKRGVISADERREIEIVSKKVALNQFRPLLCVIPRIEALPYYKRVEIDDRANPLSHEYILADLPQSAFDVIRIG